MLGVNRVQVWNFHVRSDTGWPLRSRLLSLQVIPIKPITLRANLAVRGLWLLWGLDCGPNIGIWVFWVIESGRVSPREFQSSTLTLLYGFC